MGFLDKLKDASDKAGKAIGAEYKRQQERSAELKDSRGRKLGSVSAEYIGGYKDIKKSKGQLVFYEKRSMFSSNFGTSFVLGNDIVGDVSVEGREEVDRRVTVTRLLAIGIFAFAAKKKEENKESFITVSLQDGQEVVFHVANSSPLELKRRLAKVVSNMKLRAAENRGIPTTGDQAAHQAGSAPSVADELRKLAELKKQGLLTDDEFADQKTKLLSRE